MPRIISFVAPANGSGKTSLIVTALRSRPGRFTALKASTVYRDGRHCPRSGSGCACRRLHDEFTVITDMSVLAEPRTDTGRMVKAGAARTLWCLARPGAHAAMWAVLGADHLREDELILSEGTGAIEVMRPDKIVMVVSPEPPRERWKQSAWPLIERADLVVVNGREGGPDGRRLAEEVSGRAAGRVILEDVSRPLDRWKDTGMDTLLAAFAPAVRS